MKKLLLSAGILAMALSASAQSDNNIFFQDDFEWLKPWVEAGNNKTGDEHQNAGNTIATNNPDAYCPKLNTSKVDDVSTYQAFKAKGYDFVCCAIPGTEARELGEQIYLQDCYLKFGLTSQFAGIVLPAIDKFGEGTKDVEISFDWCTMRQGSGDFDTTELVIVLKNGETEKQVKVEPLTIEKDAAFKWYPTTVKLTDETLTKDTKITIRPCDAQWPAPKKSTYRFFFDNLKVAKAGSSAVNEIKNADANEPVEYYNLQGIRVANPENGLYIVKQGNKVSKRIIR